MIWGLLLVCEDDVREEDLVEDDDDAEDEGWMVEDAVEEVPEDLAGVEVVEVGRLGGMITDSGIGKIREVL